MDSTLVKTQEIDTTVVIAEDDCGHIRNFCTQFEIEMPKRLSDAISVFEKDKTFKNQQLLKMELCHWMVTSKHASFQDKIWDEPKIYAQEVIYDIQFNEELEKALNGPTLT